MPKDLRGGVAHRAAGLENRSLLIEVRRQPEIPQHITLFVKLFPNEHVFEFDISMDYPERSEMLHGARQINNNFGLLFLSVVGLGGDLAVQGSSRAVLRYRVDRLVFVEGAT